MAELASTSLFSDANLVSYFKLEDGTAAKGPISLANNNSVTFTSAKYNNGANLGASNTNKSLSDNTNNPFGIGSGAFSIVGWWKVLSQPGTNNTFQLFDAESTTTNVSVVLEYADTSSVKNLQFQRVKNGVAGQGPTYNVDLGLTAFHHIAMTYDTVSINAYLDGALVAGPTSASGNGTSGAVAGVAMGVNRNDLASNPASVLFDDVGIFTRALSLAEIQLLSSDGHTLSMGKYW